jgi:hypothetical protein
MARAREGIVPGMDIAGIALVGEILGVGVIVVVDVVAVVEEEEVAVVAEEVLSLCWRRKLL